MMRKQLLVLLVFVSMILAVGCENSKVSTGANPNESQVEEKTTIKMGTSTVSRHLAESGKEVLEKMGYTVEIVMFDDYVLPNDALVEGTLDANFYQHEPYMNNYNDSNNTNIIMLEPKLYDYYTGIYSVKADKIEELPDGGPVGIARDASNISLQLEQLQEAGLIKLSEKPNDGKFYTVADIIDNPKGYDFIQSDHLKYTNMEDYTLILGTSNTMAEAGVDPTKNILMKFVDSKYTQGICVLAENADKQWVKDIMEAYTSEEAIKNVPASSGFEYAGD